MICIIIFTISFFVNYQFSIYKQIINVQCLTINQGWFPFESFKFWKILFNIYSWKIISLLKPNGILDYEVEMMNN
jgi:hypothetical protein